MNPNRPDYDPLDPRNPRDLRDLNDDPAYRSRFTPPRRRWPGLLAAGIIGIGIGAVVLSSFQSPSTPTASTTPPAPATDVATAPTTPPADTGASAAADGQSTPTADVTNAVKAALATDPALSTAKVDVTADAGVVTLTGSAPDSDARTRAELLASAAPGVSRVDNQLTVGGTTTQ